MSGWSNVASVVENLAPTIASVIGGPLAGSGVSALEKLFGLTPEPATSTDDRLNAVAAAVTGATPEQLAAMRKADQDYAVAMAQAGFKDAETLASLKVQADQIAAQDRDSARQREIKTGDIWTPRMLAIAIVGMYAFVQWFTLTHIVPPESRDLASRGMGILDLAVGLVLGYYFGSSVSSDRKTELLAQAPAVGGQQ